MAICITGNCIDFGTSSICNDPSGITIDGVLTHSGIAEVDPNVATPLASAGFDGTITALCGLSQNCCLQGSNRGFSTGSLPSAPQAQCHRVSWPFASDVDSVQSGGLTPCNRFGKLGHAGNSDLINQKGVAVGGRCNPVSCGFSQPLLNFSFVSDAASAGGGEMANAATGHKGISSFTDGYQVSGICPPSPSNASGERINKHPFAFPGADSPTLPPVMRLSSARINVSTHSSTTHGYISGGCTFKTPITTCCDTIEKFPFAADDGVTNIAELTSCKQAGAGVFSDTHGYSAGGSPDSTVIDKFPFSSDAPASDVGGLGSFGVAAAGVSSTTNGYGVGGSISRFPFASEATCVGVGNNIGQGSENAGHQS